MCMTMTVITGRLNSLLVSQCSTDVSHKSLINQLLVNIDNKLVHNQIESRSMFTEIKKFFEQKY